MPKLELNLSDFKSVPVGLPRADTGKSWVHIARLGSFVGIPSKQTPDRLVKKEIDSGVKLEELGNKK